MTATDRIRNLAQIAPANGVATDGIRAKTDAENNKRTERYDLRITGQVDITVAGTGIVNRGSILGALTEIGYTDGGTDKINLDARLARFIAECLAPSPLPATRLPAAGIQAATILTETVPLWMCAARTVNLNETKYVEVNKQLQQQIFVIPRKVITTLAQGPALAGTITNLTVDVQQRFDDMVGIPPWLTVNVRQIVQNVNAANPQLKIDLRGNRYCRFMAIQSDTDQGEVSDIINSLVLRGDTYSLIGDGNVPFNDLRDSAADEFGGALPPGYLGVDFTRYGRLSTMWNPYQDTNLRLEVNCQPSVTVFGGAAATGSKIRVAMVEFERTAGTAQKLPVRI